MYTAYTGKKYGVAQSLCTAKYTSKPYAGRRLHA
jgi:hypothetical protein